jgi:signal transduction histidine kinase
MTRRRNGEALFAFTRRYALVSLLAVLVTAIALAVLYRELSIRTVVAFGERANLTVAGTALNMVLPTLEQAMAVETTPETRELQVHLLPPAVSTTLSAIVRTTPVERIRIYNKDGVVVYSSHSHETGLHRKENLSFRNAMQGAVRSELDYRDVFNFLDRPVQDDNLVETYVPIQLRASAAPVGVFEVYTDVGPIVQSMVRNELAILAGIATILLILYGSLVYVVYRAHEVIARQRQAILERNQTLEVLSARMLAAEEAERRRVAWELHEQIAQTLSAVKLRVEALIAATPPHDDAAQQKLDEDVLPLLRDTIADLRLLAIDIWPPALNDFGLIEAIRWLCREAERLRDSFTVTTDITASDGEIPQLLTGVIFRVLQQTLQQLARSPSLERIHVVLKRNQHLELVVSYGPEQAIANDDESLSPTGLEQRIADIWERVILAGGSFHTTQDGTGKRVCRARWTLNDRLPESGQQWARRRHLRETSSI